MSDNLYDVAVVGAGIAGSSIAKALSSLGWNTLLIESHPFPRHKVCGEFLSPESQRSLKTLGLNEVLESLNPVPIHKVRLVSASGMVLDVSLPGTALGVSRYALDAALLSAANEVRAEVQTGVTVASVCPTNSGFLVELTRQGKRESVAARAVIAAWGRHSRPGLLRNPVSDREKTASKRNSYIGVKSHYEGVPMEAAVELYFFPGGYLGVSPIEGHRLNVCALVTPSAFTRAGRSVSAMIEAVTCWNPQLGKRLAGGKPVPGTQVAVAPVDTHRPPITWDVIPHLGDAAMMFPPLCGDGMATALRSAEVCAPLADEFLKGKLSLEKWQAAYSRALLTEYSAPLRLGRFLQTLFGAPMLPNALLGLGHLAPALAARLVRRTRGHLK